MHSASSWAAPTALATASAFAGAAVFCSLVEHPARLQLDDAAALAQWKPSFKRAAALQSALALVSAATGFKAATARAGGKDARFVWGAGLMASVVPYTLAAMMRTNKALLATATGDKTSTERLRTWGRLHLVRSVVGVVAAGAYACGLAEPVV